MLRALIGRIASRNMISYFAGLSARGLEVIGKFGLYALAARQMGAHDSGLFFLCLNWANLATTAARLGLGNATIRHVAAGIGVGHGLAARKAAVTSFIAIAVASLVAAGLTVLVARPAALLLFHQPELAWPLAVSAITIPAQAIGWATAYILIGLKRGVAAQMTLNALPPVLSLLALLAGLDDPDRLLIAYALSFSLCALGGLALVGLDWHTKLVNQPTDITPEPLPSLWAEARPFYMVEITQTAVLSMPTLILGVFASPRIVSEFSIATRLSNLVNTVVISIGTIAAPSFAEHHHRQDRAALRRVGRQARTLTLALALPIVLAMLLRPAFLLRLMGPEFGGAVNALRILALGQLVNCLLPFQDTLLAMTEHGTMLRRLNLAQLATCLILGFALIPLIGIYGAAITSTIALVSYVIGCAVMARRLVP